MAVPTVIRIAKLRQKDGKLRWLEAMGRNVVNTAANIKLTVDHLGIYIEIVFHPEG